MKKKGVKKGSAQAQEFAKRKEDEKILWTIQTIAYTQQEILDSVCITLNEEFEFGPEREKRFRDRFDVVYAEIRKLEKEDTIDGEYSKEKVEQALKRACGKYYEPREVRYDFTLNMPDGRVFKI